MMAEYLENTIFQKISDFPFDLSVSARMAVGHKRKTEKQIYPVQRHEHYTNVQTAPIGSVGSLSKMN